MPTVAISGSVKMTEGLHCSACAHRVSRGIVGGNKPLVGGDVGQPPFGSDIANGIDAGNIRLHLLVDSDHAVVLDEDAGFF